MKTHRILLVGMLVSLLLVSCKKEEVIDDEGGDNSSATVTLTEKTVTGTAKYWSPLSGMALWADGPCTLTARLEEGGSDILGTGTISVDGSFTITYKAKVPQTPFVAFNNFMWGNNVSYSPADGSMIHTVRHFIEKPDGTQKELFIKEFKDNLWSAGWSPVVMTKTGSINGTDLMGIKWTNYDFTKGWNFHRSIYDMPSIGKQTNECYANPKSDATWYVGY